MALYLVHCQKRICVAKKEKVVANTRKVYLIRIFIVLLECEANMAKLSLY